MQGSLRIWIVAYAIMPPTAASSEYMNISMQQKQLRPRAYLYKGDYAGARDASAGG